MMRSSWLVLLASLAMVPGIARSQTGAEPTAAEERAFRAAVARVAPAVVRIEPLALAAVAAGGELQPGQGPSTGLVVAPGFVMTTAFAIPEDLESALVVLPDGGRRAGRVRGRDRSRGLVLLAVENLPDAAALEPVPRSELAAGQWAIAVGRGWSASRASVAVGIVSAVNRAWGRAVQTDAAVSPMNYGGPLVDIAGRVIGMLAPLPADTAGSEDGTELYDAGIGFAVPLEDMLAILPRLERGESLATGLLGIGYRSRDTINGEPVVGSVQAGSPAATAGLAAGDRLVSIDDKPIARIADARQAIAARHAGDPIAIVIERGRDADAAAPPATIAVNATLVEQLPPWRRSVLGMLAEGTAEEGIRVAWLLPGGPAERAGLRPGDAILWLAVGDAPPTPLAGPEMLADRLAGIPPGGSVRLTYRRAERETAVAIETAAALAEVPATGPTPGADAIDPIAGPVAAVEVIRLAAADVAEPAVAVLPPGSDPVGVLVWLSPPHGPVAESEAAIWKAAAARHGIAVVLPGSNEPAAWSRGDIASVDRALAALNSRRRIDPGRLGIGGSGAGAAFAWLLAERLGDAARGVALVETGLPRLANVKEASPGRDWWILLGPGSDADAAIRIEADRRRLVEAGYPAGLLPAGEASEPPTDLLGRWVSLLGLL